MNRKAYNRRHYQTDLEYYDDVCIWLKKRLHLAVVELRRSRGEGFREGFGGVFVSDEEVDEILLSFLAGRGGNSGVGKIRWSIRSLTKQWRRIELKRKATGGLKLDELAKTYDLSVTERFVLLLSFLPSLEPRLGKVYGYLADDVHQKQLTLALCQSLYPETVHPVQWHKTLFFDEPLLKAPLLHVDSKQQQRLLQPIVCEDGVANFLMGYYYPDQCLEAHLDIRVPQQRLGTEGVLGAIANMAQSLDVSRWPVTGIASVDVDTLLQQIADSMQKRVYWLKLPFDAERSLFDRWLRDSWMHQAIPVLTLMAKAPDWLSTQRYGYLLIKQNDGVADIVWPSFVAWHLADEGLDSKAQVLMWQRLLPEPIMALEQAQDTIEQISEQFSFNLSTIRQICKTLQHRLGFLAVPAQLEELLAQCRHFGAAPMMELAEHVPSRFHWQDLILPDDIRAQLLSLKRSIRYSDSFVASAKMDQVLGVSAGVCALFSGPSGTGKTMAAGVIANELSLDLYRIDLSRVVSKYIGETEKNLDRIFTAASLSKVVLFFDEGDALFGKRSQVKDAHDRYANIEISYLLQKIESHPGTTIIATNLADNIDEAFARRIDHMVAFPMPSQAQRKGIWQRLQLLSVTLDEDIDFDFLARQFELTGGQIKNCLILACFIAKEAQSPVAMVHLVRAVAVEMRKQKKPINRTLFAGFYGQLDKA